MHIVIIVIVIIIMVVFSLYAILTFIFQYSHRSQPHRSEYRKRICMRLVIKRGRQQ